MGYMIGVDVGGTFTDLSVFSTDSRRIYNHKLSSTPGDPSQAIVEGIRQVLALYGIAPDDVTYLAHGTTVATNALIERKGSRVGLITTEGFRDMMEIGWQKRPNLYDLLRPKPVPLIPPGLKCEVSERILYNGEVMRPLDEDSVRRAVGYLRRQGAETIAVCTLFSFLNPSHELRIGEIIAEEFPEVYVTLSHQLVHEFREYSRMSTAVLNAYLGPVMKTYVHNFEQSVQLVGITAQPYVTQSNGSIISIAETIECPIKTAVSGPSAGVIGAACMGSLCGIRNIITFDMGGTSADISLIENGRPQLSTERMVEGYPARISMIDIITIGAGGGSIARIDEGGVLKVGPESAGARPGPACYGRGGERPTVTDANILLGKLNQKKILGGRMEVRLNLAEQALERICAATDMNRTEVATGIISVVNSNMLRAIRVLSVERGYDVREFTLMAFGGAGPLHACEIAEELNISQVLIPPSPGTLCSLGLLMADTKFDLSRSNIMLAQDENLEAINGTFDEMVEEGHTLLDREHIVMERRSFTRSVDARYERQNYELNIPLPDAPLTPALLQEALEEFHAAHQKSFGYSNSQFRVQFVCYRLSAHGEIEKPDLQPSPDVPDAKLPHPAERRMVQFVGRREPIDTPVYHRDSFVPGLQDDGPMIVEQMDTTTVIPPDWSVRADGYGNLHLSRIMPNGGITECV